MTDSHAQDGVVERLWAALREVEDPEIPVSLVDMGLIVALNYAWRKKMTRVYVERALSLVCEVHE